MANKIPRVPVREQDPKVRATNFEEVCYGYNAEEAQLEASRCLNCKNPRCVGACPVNVKIPQFISEIASGNFAKAAEVLAEDSSLPAICGRVCPQESQCEGSCILGIKGESVAIGKLERFAADWSRENGGKNTVVAPANGHKVAVIGSGPAGLACAYDLAKLGYDVTIFEALHRPGGVLEYGIPEFRLPKDKIVAAEIADVKALGVKIETNVIVGRTVTIDSLLDEEGFSAVFVGSGAGLPRFMNIPGENLNGVLSCNEYLTRVNLMDASNPATDTPLLYGKNVAVIGGGNTAMDAVRTAKRLGAERAMIIYRRSEEEMPARIEEVHHAKQEGIEFLTLHNPIEYHADENGRVNEAVLQVMELGEPDESGRRSPVPVEGKTVTLPVDLVIVAVGVSPNPLIPSSVEGLEISKKGTIVVNEGMQSALPMLFAGGDIVRGGATVILAMSDGRKAAKAMHEYLS